MLVKNNSNDIYMLKSGDMKLQLYPWRVVDVDPIFTTDTTFQIGVKAGKLIILDQDAPQEPQEAPQDAPDTVNDETPVEEPEEVSEPKTRAKTTRKK